MDYLDVYTSVDAIRALSTINCFPNTFKTTNQIEQVKEGTPVYLMETFRKTLPVEITFALFVARGRCFTVVKKEVSIFMFQLYLYNV